MIESLRQLTWLPPLLDITRLFIFGAFLLLGLQAARARDSRPSASRLIAFVIAITTAVGLTQKESWPFTNWALVHSVAQEDIRQWSLEGSQGGRWWRIDPRIIEPIPPEDFDVWLGVHLRTLDAPQQNAVLQFLLDRANATRARVAAGGRVSGNARILGPLTAPYHFQRMPAWRTAQDVPAMPFTSIRIVETEWNVRERASNDAAVKRHTIMELPVAR